MSKIVTSPYSAMRASIDAVIASAGRIKASIDGHAAQSAAELNAMRRAAEDKARIDEGIARQNG